ncbi:hypothetical protein A3K93_00290 [Acinetobacter sp. NCu2D-2]|uniref:deoxyribodipyrimidine photo-lyase n=1 Tax=Acinetobacter sp. NCu2D-2 TaxID=1608473 RepID=UPI0007CDB6E4|nr:deoxyribodipyrimidine photo-lyase [Acinetobacter sp. NCu2D-2]ANF80783.1 hypothetical protein A3K93_00290 [Acinetobacter sp. NCu2D-2]
MQLVWFRQDLRIHDHSALFFAAQHGLCIGVVFLTPEQWRLHQDADIKIDLYLRRLKVLKTQLAELNIPLLILEEPLWQHIPTRLLELCQSLNIHHVHANIEVGFNEEQRDQVALELLKKLDIQLSLYEDLTLFPLTTIRNGSNQPYQVFTAFKKKCYERLILDVPACLPDIGVQKELKLNLSLKQVDLYQFAQPYHNPDIAQLWSVEDETIEQRLHHFLTHSHHFRLAQVEDSKSKSS